MGLKQVVFITGASSGIGLTTAKFLTENGFKVYGMAIDDFKSQYFTYVKGDVTKEAEVKQILNDIYKKEGRLDIIINNAGIGISGAVEHTLESSVHKIFNVNVYGTMLVSKLAVPLLRENGGGKIINISSVASELNIPFQAYYSATKSAIQAFSMALRNEVKDFNIKVSCVLPGDAKTGFTKARQKNLVEHDINYGTRIQKSVSQMEKDEQNGLEPIEISKTILSLLKAKNPKPVKVVGFKYKVFVVLNRLLPRRFVSWVLYKLYGGN